MNIEAGNYPMDPLRNNGDVASFTDGLNGLPDYVLAIAKLDIEKGERRSLPVLAELQDDGSDCARTVRSIVVCGVVPEMVSFFGRKFAANISDYSEPVFRAEIERDDDAIAYIQAVMGLTAFLALIKGGSDSLRVNNRLYRTFTDRYSGTQTGH